MKEGRETTQEERIEIVTNSIASGKNYGEMALKYQVSYQQDAIPCSTVGVSKHAVKGSQKEKRG